VVSLGAGSGAGSVLVRDNPHPSSARFCDFGADRFFGHIFEAFFSQNTC
jgi:hypothetical protein